MVAEIPKSTGYVVSSTSGGSNTKATGYVLTSDAADSVVQHSSGYALVNNSSTRATIGDSKSYAVLSNPATVFSSHSYAMLTNSLEAILTESKGYAVLYSFYPPYEDVVTQLGFTENRFPDCISFGSSGGPGFKTGQFTVDSGLTSTEVEWERIRARYVANFENATVADIQEVENFFYMARGRAVGFRYKDWLDYTIATQNFMVGDGTTKTFQLFKRYTSGSYTFDRIIRKPIGSTFTVTLDGVTQILNQDYYVNNTTGEIVFFNAPANNSLGTIVEGQFDVPVRFDTDRLDISYEDHQQFATDLPLIEVLG